VCERFAKEKQGSKCLCDVFAGVGCASVLLFGLIGKSQDQHATSGSSTDQRACALMHVTHSCMQPRGADIDDLLLLMRKIDNT
jgi:hypothetical protein